MSKELKGSLIVFLVFIGVSSLFIVLMTAYVNGTDSRVKHETISYEKLAALENIPEGGVYVIARTGDPVREIASHKIWHWHIRDSEGNYRPSDLTCTVDKKAYGKMDSNFVNALENHRDCELKLYSGSTDHLMVESVMNIEAFYPSPELFLFILLGGLILAVPMYIIQKSDNKKSKKAAASGRRKAVSSRGFNESDNTLLSAAALLAVEEDEKAERDRKIKDSGKCDGDCEHCPPHYGYRYGRWYYGHDHVYGCERGGNRCGGGL